MTSTPVLVRSTSSTPLPVSTGVVVSAASSGNSILGATISSTATLPLTTATPVGTGIAVSASKGVVRSKRKKMHAGAYTPLDSFWMDRCDTAWVRVCISLGIRYI